MNERQIDLAHTVALGSIDDEDHQAVQELLDSEDPARRAEFIAEVHLTREALGALAAPPAVKPPAAQRGGGGGRPAPPRPPPRGGAGRGRGGPPPPPAPRRGGLNPGGGGERSEGLPGE
ncbi:RskA family anti-sigma factor, partial [Nocardia cyriacigeorgica]|uniref:RskA family anti-sigma factor n=1 Tax=Nocardia cyriacigeorgica TaxID=135487 RepID=UPI00245867E8